MIPDLHITGKRALRKAFFFGRCFAPVPYSSAVLPSVPDIPRNVTGEKAWLALPPSARMEGLLRIPERAG